ncbi:ABC transporter permease [Staphylococcus massiliensis]|uniref:ABC transporter permease n=1 Tax=Staphylococcus massiliensis TaxID=555791 RepID=UPI001EDC9D19|nr:ABC transporter permease subunit [Staphylococcus massiliensis]
MLNLFSKKSNQGVHQASLLQRMWSHKMLYLMLLPCILFFFIFNYLPMSGLILSVKEFRFDKGLWGGDWIGLKYFKRFFGDSRSYSIIINTLVISFVKLVLAFPFPVILAIMFNEINQTRFKRLRGFLQGITYLPHFLSWVVVIGVVHSILAPNTGLINEIAKTFGGDGSTHFLMEPKYFLSIVFSSYIWKDIGWNSIIYFAAIMGINQDIYESAAIDGANRVRQIIYITIPSLVPTMVILFILSLGDVLKAGFDQIYLLKTPGNASVSEIIDTYVIRTGIQQGDFSYAIAIGLIQGLIGLILVLVVNKLASRKFDTSLF